MISLGLVPPGDGRYFLLSLSSVSFVLRRKPIGQKGSIGPISLLEPDLQTRELPVLTRLGSAPTNFAGGSLWRKLDEVSLVFCSVA